MARSAAKVSVLAVELTTTCSLVAATVGWRDVAAIRKRLIRSGVFATAWPGGTETP
jgi:hypothetical protein